MMNEKSSKSRNIRRMKTITLASILLMMLVYIAAAMPAPTLNFIYPTPANNSYQTADFAQINISIVEHDLDTFEFNWNGTNYTFYDDSLVFAMNLNNNSAIGENATHAVDISSYKNNGTLVNGPAWTPSGRFGSALDFDGSNDYVEVSDSDSLDFGTNTDFTIESWIKADSGNNNQIVGKGDWGSNKGYYTRLFNGKLNARINDGTNSTIGSGNTNLVDDLWHHVAVVFDRDDKMRFYVDGVLDGESASISSVGDINNDFTLRIASYPWGGWYFNGTIDEVSIYNRSLSATEIKMQYLSEFKKHNSTHWYFYDNVTGLPDGVHNYTGWAKDTSNNVNQTETRILNVALSAGPLADYGDAPDPMYPSLYCSQGPYHLDVSQEWIGTSSASTTTVEIDALVPDGDFDDGVIRLRRTLVGGQPANESYVTVPITINGTADNQIRYLNVVADLNQDGNWQAYSLGSGITQQEWIVRNLAIFTEPGTSVNISVPFVLLDTSVMPPDQIWMRATLTTEIIDPTIFGLAGWNGTGPVGGFLRGETEDHLISVENHTFFLLPSGRIPRAPPGFCGDGIVQHWLGEQCDPPDGVTCDANCQLIPPPLPGFCGDGIVQHWLGEQCDPPDGVTCDANCQNIPQPPDPVPVDGIEKESVPDITQPPNSKECGPTSAANSLYFLGKAYGFSDKLPGSPDNSRPLIEELKRKMAPNWQSPAPFPGVEDPNFIQGKKDIAKQLGLPIETHCQDDNEGQIPTVDFICSELKKCQDVELGLTFDGGGGHWVTAVGCTKYSDGSVKLKIHDPDDDLTGDVNYWVGQRSGGYLSLINYKDKSGNNLPNIIDIVCAESPIPIEVKKTVWNPATGRWDTSRVAKVCDNLTFNCTIHASCFNLSNITVTDILSCSLNYTNNATVHYPNGTTAKIEPEVSYYPCNNTTVKWFFPGPLNKSETITITFDAHKVKCCNNTNTQYVTAWCNETGKWVNSTSNTVDIFCKKRIGVERKKTPVQPQDQFTVNITVDPACHCVYGAQYDLYYNTSVVRAETQVKGPFLGDSSETIVVINEIDQTNGIVSYAETRKENESGVTKAGTLATIQFTAIGERGDIGNLNLSDVIIVDCNNTPNYDTIIENGTVEITNNTQPVANGTSKHQINNVAKKYPCNTVLCSCSHDPDYPGKGGNITYIQWAFGDGQYGTSEGPHLNNCTCKEHRYESWQWEPIGDPNGDYVPFNAVLTVTDDGCPELTNTTDFNVTVHIAGDANGDGRVNILDAVYVGKHWGEDCSTTTDPCADCEGYLWGDEEQQDKADLNNDCVINILDAVIIGANWGHAAW